MPPPASMADGQNFGLMNGQLFSLNFPELPNFRRVGGILSARRKTRPSSRWRVVSAGRLLREETYPPKFVKRVAKPCACWSLRVAAFVPKRSAIAADAVRIERDF